jgi:chemotaxis protein CheY-P-specific phosphatase CheC
MSDQLNETLAAVAEDTIMSLAFLFLMSEDEAGGGPDGSAMVASVDFSGPFTGALFIAGPKEMLPELAANMLGFEEGAEPPSAAVQNDALQELLNVICGNLLPEIAGAEAVFKVHAPKLHEEDIIPETFQDLPPAGRTELYSEYGKLELTLFLDNHALV